MKNIEKIVLEPTGYYYKFKTFDEMTRLFNWEIFLANELISRIEKEQKNSVDFKIKQKEEKYISVIFN